MIESYAKIRFVRPSTKSAVTIQHLLYLGAHVLAMDEALLHYHWRHAVRQASVSMPGWEVDPHVVELASV